MGHDFEPVENLTIGVSFYLAKSREQAIREMKPFYEEHVKMFEGVTSGPRAECDKSACPVR